MEAEVAGEAEVGSSGGGESLRGETGVFHSNRGGGGSGDGSLNGDRSMSDMGLVGNMDLGGLNGDMLLLEDRLVDGGVGGNGANDGLLGEDGLVLEDGLVSVVGLHNGSGLHVSDGSGLVDVRSLSNGVRGNGDLILDAGISVGLGGRIGEVAAKAMRLDGGGVVRGGADQLGVGITDLLDGDLRGGGGRSQDSGEDDKSLKEPEAKEELVRVLEKNDYVT